MKSKPKLMGRVEVLDEEGNLIETREVEVEIIDEEAVMKLLQEQQSGERSDIHD